LIKKCREGRESVGLLYRLIRAKPKNTGKSHREAALVALRGHDALKPEFHHQVRCHLAYGPKLLQNGFTNDLIHLLDLRIRQARIGLGKGNQGRRVNPVIPEGKAIIGVEARTSAMPTLRIDKHRVYRQGVALPLPALPLRGLLLPPLPIGRLAMLEHEALCTFLSCPRPQVQNLGCGEEHHFVGRGITEPYIFESLHYKPNRSRVALEFTSVADAPHLAKQFGRLYYTQEMAVSDCE